MNKNKIIFLSFNLLFLMKIFSQEDTRPSWGTSYCLGRTFDRSNNVSSVINVPLSWDWRYSSWDIYKIWNVKNLSISTGITWQSNVVQVRVYPRTNIAQANINPLLGYIQTNYYFISKRKLSPYIGMGFSGRLLDYNSILSEAGIRIRPIKTCPIWFNLHLRVSRNYSKPKFMYYYNHLDNAAIGVSILYNFKKK